MVVNPTIQRARSGDHRGTPGAVVRSHFIEIVIVSIWLGMIAASIGLESATGRSVPLCLFRNVTGSPCPTCGSTRAVLSLSQADVWAALRFNPLVTLVVLALPVRIALLWRRRSSMPLRSRRARWLLPVALVLLGINWIYVLRFGPDAVFGGRPQAAASVLAQPMPHREMPCYNIESRLMAASMVSGFLQ